MMRSFTTFLVLLAATLSLTTAFDNYRILITRSDDADESHCTNEVNDDIDEAIHNCVDTATGNNEKHPKRKKPNRRRALRTAPAATRELYACNSNDCGCSTACQMMGYCADTCSWFSPCVCDRRLEEEFLESDDSENVSERELTMTDNAAIELECKKQLRDLAKDSTNNCLGDHNDLFVTCATSG
jgi:hypothetical protein